MRIADKIVEDFLQHSGKVDADQLSQLRAQEKSEKRPLQDLVVSGNILSEKELTKLYADAVDVPYVDLNPKNIKRELFMQLPERIARQYNAVVFDVDEDGVKYVAMADPDDIQAVNFLQKQLGNNLHVYIAPESQIQSALDTYRGNIEGELTKVISSDELSSSEEDESVDENDLKEDSPIAQTVNLIIEYGVKNAASDIHIEPREKFVVVRYRIDGILREANKLPRRVLNALVSRIKILANLKIDEHRAPQDGRFKIAVGSQVFALRVSTLPIVDGEKVVMRILNESVKAATLEELGFWGDALKLLQQAIVQPHGMILVTGPTGSGKSTTLFSVLSLLNTPSVNISTVEDPVEYRIQGVNQTQVNPIAGMTFANGLRSLLRQDPNIIMVGEVRDTETADLAVQAALTGHLVFSTLHTSDAATCLPRLMDMGVEPFLIASTVRAVIGQRLVRRLCQDCREQYAPDNGVLARIKDAFALQGAQDFSKINNLERQALKDGIGIDKDGGKATVSDLSSSDKSINRLWRAHEDGCATCNHTGYKGRIGIYEVMDNDQPIQKAIVTNTTSEALESLAVSSGMITMHVDGLIKSLRGQTTLEEVLRVTSASKD
ncbi:MAG: GspE/PulE family protein [Candidatus Saccharimonadales bacterium]